MEHRIYRDYYNYRKNNKKTHEDISKGKSKLGYMGSYIHPEDSFFYKFEVYIMRIAHRYFTEIIGIPHLICSIIDFDYINYIKNKTWALRNLPWYSTEFQTSQQGVSGYAVKPSFLSEFLCKNGLHSPKFIGENDYGEGGFRVYYICMRCQKTSVEIDGKSQGWR